MRYDAKFFYAYVLPDIKRNLCHSKRRRTLRGVFLHLDNAPAHNTKRPRDKIARTKASRIVHPAYSPDAAPSDFFLFGNQKGEMADFTANSLTDFISEIRRIFQEISKETLVAVHGEWITRLEWITEHKGEYHHTEQTKSITL
jgi:histone-lysine N-methyltransferase SETMAR